MSSVQLMALLAILIPFVCAIIVRAGWSRTLKECVSFALCLALGVILAYFKALETGTVISVGNALQLVVIGLATSRAVYSLMRSNGATSAIMDWLVENANIGFGS